MSTSSTAGLPQPRLVRHGGRPADSKVRDIGTERDAIKAFGTVAGRKGLLRARMHGVKAATGLGGRNHRVRHPRILCTAGANLLDAGLAPHQARRTCSTKAEELGLWTIRPMKLPHVAVAPAGASRFIMRIARVLALRQWTSCADAGPRPCA
ncbi:hypothetical protein [Arthrobacter livingstonensis]|uniref:hypothetical protein n=1 Tax=Arthrobacter livingstonensis TaxID=670078 RepID=UPI0011B5F7E4|nr:hypothetical protein [Arthrobacter livingstonensis]